MDQRVVNQIINLEWDMFSSVQNVGGKASCQSQPKTFCIMRASQLLTWSDEVLNSYLADLKAAKEAGRNPLAEKYGYMMESTYPEEYEAIRDRLPVVDPKTLALIEEIVAINMEWEQVADRDYPHMRANGRPARTTQDTRYETSCETYLRGELKSYSAETVRLLHDYTLACRAEGRNLPVETLEHMAHAYGYDSAAQADAAMANRAAN